MFSELFPCHYNSSVFHCPASLYCLNICVCLHLDPALGKRWMGSRLRYAWAAVSYSSRCPVCTSVNWKFYNEEKTASGLILLVYMKQNPSSHRLYWSMAYNYYHENRILCDCDIATLWMLKHVKLLTRFSAVCLWINLKMLDIYLLFSVAI